MFTLEESAHLGFMLRVIATVVAVVVLALLCTEAVHWLHVHHRTILLHAM